MTFNRFTAWMPRLALTMILVVGGFVPNIQADEGQTDEPVCTDRNVIVAVGSMVD